MRTDLHGNGVAEMVPSGVSTDGETTDSVMLSRKLIVKHFEGPGLDIYEKQFFVNRMLYECERMVDGWRGELDVYEFSCIIAAARHDCCGSLCQDFVDLKGVYRRVTDERPTLCIMLNEEEPPEAL